MHDQHDDQKEEPADLLKDYLELFTEKTLPGPVLDVASGEPRARLMAPKGFGSI